MDGWMDGRTDGWMDCNFKSKRLLLNVNTLVKKRKLRWFGSQLKVLWLSKYNFTGHSERKKKKKKEMGRQEMLRNGLC